LRHIWTGRGAAVFAVMTTWRRGREHLFARLRASSVPLEPFLKSLFVDPPQRVPGTAVFLTATPEATPHALLHNLNHNKVLPFPRRFHVRADG